MELESNLCGCAYVSGKTGSVALHWTNIDDTAMKTAVRLFYINPFSTSRANAIAPLLVQKQKSVLRWQVCLFLA